MPTKIPLPVNSFVRRASELEQTTAVLGESRVVTLTGAGRVGTTRLALQAAAQVAPHFADGAWVAELAQVRDVAGVGNAVAAVFSVTARSGRALSGPAPVKTHALRTLTKLGLDSRVQLASWVAGHDPGPPGPACR
jgi:predicted ATPase